MTAQERRHEIIRLLFATLFFGAAGGIFAATLNNYLSEIHGFGAEARGWLEFPRELPGFLLVGVTGLLALWMRESKMAGLAMGLAAFGAVGLGYLSTNMGLLVLFVAVWSLGDHILFAVDAPLGLQLAKVTSPPKGGVRGGPVAASQTWAPAGLAVRSHRLSEEKEIG